MSPSSPPVDFLVGSAVTVRVHGSPAEVGLIARQIGPPAPHADDAAGADISIRFVDRLAGVGREVLVGLDDAAFDDRHFLVLRGRHKSRTRVAMPLDAAGGPMEITCERGLRAVPLLISLINLAAVGRGIVPIHASAFVHEGRGVLVTGWSKGGKTETILAFTARGAAFVGDEWVYLHPDGTVVGLPEPVRLWEWQLAQLPRVRARLGRATLTGLSALRLATGATAAAARLPVIGASPLGRILRRAEPVLDRQLAVQVPPVHVFETIRPAARVDVLVLVMSITDRPITATRVDPTEVADRVAQSNAHERIELLTAYRKFRYAFPGRPSTAMEEVDEREARLLHAGLDRLPAIRLDHPYPPTIAELFPVLDRALSALPPGSND